MKKTFIDVIVKYTKEGNKIPLEIIWTDSRKFSIDKITDIKKASSLKSGGKGIRFTCKIMGKKVYLFLDDDKWFLET
ncbi:UNVERIFIED_CONTAM: hypothetical protein Cloal_3082 [Acetivibrio alkalicellulosi]